MSGQKLSVLKIRKIAGRIYLMLSCDQNGSLSIPSDWTDYFPSGQEAILKHGGLIPVDSLHGLCELVKKYIDYVSD
jgi:hypothetical protein